MQIIQELNNLVKAIEAGNLNSAPSSMTQLAAATPEDLSPVMQNVCYQEKALKLRKSIKSRANKNTLVQFTRQLSYGVFGGSAQLEGGIGEEDTPDIVKGVVPMCYYSTVRRVTTAAQAVEANVDPDELVAESAAKTIAGDIEFDCFRGMDDFSNAGIFDGNPDVFGQIPNIHGIGTQVRLSDSLANTQDLMFAEYGSNASVILPVNGTVRQTTVEDAAVKAGMNHSDADKLFLDYIALSAYNKVALAKERIVLAGTPTESTGAHLRVQMTSVGPVSIESSRFLAGKTGAARARSGSPAAPTLSATNTGDATSVLSAGTYYYKVTACNMRGESVMSAQANATVGASERATLTIGAVTGATHYNVYRGSSASEAPKFIGRIKVGSSGASFRDCGRRSAGFCTGYLVDSSTWELAQLLPFTSKKLAEANLSTPTAFYEFATLTGLQPRKNIILDNIVGQIA